MSWVTAGFTEGGRGEYSGKGPQPKNGSTWMDHHESAVTGGIQNNSNCLVAFYFICEFDVNKCIPFQASQRPVRWTEQEVKLNRKKEKSSKIWRLVLVERRCWLSGTRSGQGFNCGVGCTFHSALFQAGSWRCSGGRTTWRRRRRGPRGPPSPHNPGSWRAVHQRYLEAPEIDFIFLS